MIFINTLLPQDNGASASTISVKPIQAVDALMPLLSWFIFAEDYKI